MMIPSIPLHAVSFGYICLIKGSALNWRNTQAQSQSVVIWCMTGHQTTNKKLYCGNMAACRGINNMHQSCLCGILVIPLYKHMHLCIGMYVDTAEWIHSLHR